MTNQDNERPEKIAKMVIEEAESTDKDSNNMGRRSPIPGNIIDLSATEKEVNSDDTTAAAKEPVEKKKSKKGSQKRRMGCQKVGKRWGLRCSTSHSQSAVKTPAPPGFENISKTEAQITETGRQQKGQRSPDVNSSFQVRSKSQCKVSSTSSGTESLASIEKFQQKEIVTVQSVLTVKRVEETSSFGNEIDSASGSYCSSLHVAIRASNPTVCSSSAKTEKSLGSFGMPGPKGRKSERDNSAQKFVKNKENKIKAESKLKRRRKRGKSRKSSRKTTDSSSNVEQKCEEIELDEVAVRTEFPGVEGTEESRTERGLSEPRFDSCLISLTQRTNAPDGMNASATEVSISAKIGRKVDSKIMKKNISQVEPQVMEETPENVEEAQKLQAPKKVEGVRRRKKSKLKIINKRMRRGCKKPSKEQEETISMSEPGIRERISGDMSNKTEVSLLQEMRADQGETELEVNKKVSEGQLKRSVRERSKPKLRKSRRRSSKRSKSSTALGKREKSKKIKGKKKSFGMVTELSKQNKTSEKKKYKIGGTFRINIESQED